MAQVATVRPKTTSTCFVARGRAKGKKLDREARAANSQQDSSLRGDDEDQNQGLKAEIDLSPVRQSADRKQQVDRGSGVGGVR